MADNARARRAFLCAAAGGLALLAAVAAVLWSMAGKPSRAAAQNFGAVAGLLFSLPDPIDVVRYGKLYDSMEEYSAAMAAIGPEQDFDAQAAPYCTERGLSMVSYLNHTLGRSCVGTENTTDVRSVSIGKKDETGYYPFTVTIRYGVPGEPGESVDFEGTVNFDEQGLISYCYISHLETTRFAARTSNSPFN